MNKKGFLASYIVDFYAYLAFVIIIIIFFVVLSFSGSPINKQLPAEHASADTTTVLIKALQTPIPKLKMTPADIISKEDRSHEKEFQQTIQRLIDTAYPAKKDIHYAWLRVYPNNEVPADPCSLQSQDSGTYFKQDKGFAYGTRVTSAEFGTPITTRVEIPLTKRTDYVVAIFCIASGYFR